MSGRIRFRQSLHLSRTAGAAHSLGRNQIFLAEARRACLSQPQGWAQAAKPSDPVSLNSAAAPQDKEASLPLKLPQTPSAEKGLSKQNRELKTLLGCQQKDGTHDSCLQLQVPTEHSTDCIIRACDSMTHNNGKESGALFWSQTSTVQIEGHHVGGEVAKDLLFALKHDNRKLF